MTNAALAIEIDFENANRGASTQSFSGLTFNEKVHILPSAAVTTGPGQSGNVARAQGKGSRGSNKGGSLSGFFEGFTASELSFIVGDGDPDTDFFQLMGYDIDGQLIADSGPQSSETAILVGIAGQGIATFVLSISDQPDTGGSSLIDNVSYSVYIPNVPLPATLPSLIFAMILLTRVSRNTQTART